MTDFLLELRSEEIPARMQAGARADLEKLFRAEMQAAGVAVGEVTVWSTPRRLALIARGLPGQTETSGEEIKGPRTSAPQPAIDGFLRKHAISFEQLVERDGTWFALIETPGRPMKAVLAEAIPAIVRAFPWPKSMRWGAASLSTESLRWVRPLSGIVAIFGEDLVECQVGDIGGSPGKVGTGFPSGDPTTGISSGYMTLGHRFHCPGPITIGGAADYQEKLRACHVIVDHAERQELIREGARKAAAEAGLTLVEDEGLVIENAGLTEWPVPLLGRFDEAYLDVPPEVIQLTARVNQKYFVCKGPPLVGEGDHAKHGGEVSRYREGDTPPSAAAPLPPPLAGEDRLANAFVCTANVEAADGGAAIVDGNRKVLAARLSDARFFWEQDRKVPLAEQAKKLERITFHEKLGTVADKVERVAKLARWLVESGVVKPMSVRPEPVEGRASAAPANRASTSSARTVQELADLAEQAARLAKADLVTEMVGEFPELQGLMGGYYARAEGLPPQVADAIRDHYKPVGQGDEVPTAPVTVAVSLADKLDTLFSFFSHEMMPTGSKDPFALRRAGLAIISLLTTNGIRLSLIDAVSEHMRPRLFDTENFEGMRSALHAAYRGEPSQDIEGLALVLVFTLLQNSADFFADRLKVQQREAGVRHDLIDAVFALGNEDDLVRLLARVNALQHFIKTEDGANLLAAYKRAANILKKEDWKGDANEPGGEIARTGEEDPLALVDDPDLKPVVEARLAEKKKKQLSYTPEPAEKALIEALDSAEPKAAAAVQAEDFEAAMAALASLRAPIDKFFDEVTVNDSDPAKRRARLDLLGRFRAAVHEVADFSKIEG